MVMTKEKRARLAELLSRGEAATNKAALPHAQFLLPFLPHLPPLLLKPPRRLFHHNQFHAPLPHTLLLTPLQPQTASAPTSPTPIAAIPLATLRASASPTP